MNQQTNVTRFFADHADAFRLRGDFHAMGAAAFLATNERVPAGFFESIRNTFAPDGYVLGVGCGNVISMLGAFASTPRGMILVDLDPAVIFFGNMFIACLRRHAQVEGFVEEFFCGGRKALQQLESEVLEQADPFEIKRFVEPHRDRLWKGLSFLTEGFSQQPEDVRPLLDEWASYFPTAAQRIPARAFISCEYAKLQALAVAGNIAIIYSTIFDPALLGVVSRLPGFECSVNLIYTSNVADHILRRAMCASGRSKLLLSTERLSADEAINSPADFVELLKGEARHLDSVSSASRDSVFVYTDEGRELLLEAGDEFPRYAAENFYFQFNLDRLAAAVLAGPGEFTDLAEEDRVSILRNPWVRAPRDRAMARALYGAAVRADEKHAGALLKRFVEELGDPDCSPLAVDDPRYVAFWIAEVCLAALLIERSEIATRLADELAELRRALVRHRRSLASRQADFLSSSGGKSTELLLFAQAFGLAGRLLADDELGELSHPFVGAALASAVERRRMVSISG